MEEWKYPLARSSTKEAGCLLGIPPFWKWINFQKSFHWLTDNDGSKYNAENCKSAFLITLWFVLFGKVSKYHCGIILNHLTKDSIS